MTRFRYFAQWLLPALLLFSSRGSPAAPQEMEIAITVDDLPSHGTLPPQTTRLDIARRLINTLKAHGVPSVYGFINGYRLNHDPENVEVLKLWVEAGFLLGNHTYAQSDLRTIDAQMFEKDIAANEPSLESLMGSRDWHWFRFPFAHEGDTLEKRRAVRTYLDEHGYKIAPVTLDFQGYAWNTPYARCAAKGDTKAIEWLKASYLSTATEYIALGQKVAHMLYGRDIKHVLLLHIGAFDSLVLPMLLDQLTQQGVHFVSLQDATADPAFHGDRGMALPHGATLLEQSMHAKQMQYPPHAAKPLEKLSSMCL